MVNLYDKNRFISKSTLAKLADVSPRTFRRYLQTRRHILDAMGISPKAQKLPPQAVRYICEDYCIDLPPELQDQEALSKSPDGVTAFTFRNTPYRYIATSGYTFPDNDP